VLLYLDIFALRLALLKCLGGNRVESKPKLEQYESYFFFELLQERIELKILIFVTPSGNAQIALISNSFLYNKIRSRVE
jgi:hypothetical protein